MTNIHFYIGLDDTDAPDGMCTTWLGALLATIIKAKGMRIISTRLVRLNPTIPYKTRGNAAISLSVIGDPDYTFDLTCSIVLKYASLSCENTHPGIVVSLKKPPSDFYWKAVSGICTIDEARSFLPSHVLHYQGYKLGRGLIGAAAAVCSEFPDHTWELLAYREPERFLLPREVNADSLRLSEDITSPHTWDTWDPDLNGPVCIPHTPDPVLFGIRGDSPYSVYHAYSAIQSEKPGMYQIWMTNQGTDAHLVFYDSGLPQNGISYLMRGFVCTKPKTGEGGHVSFDFKTREVVISCMAFEPTKKFRDIVRSLRPGDELLVAGSYLKETLNLEKIYVFSAEPYSKETPPLCLGCGKRMTSAGYKKGFKCKRCGAREKIPEITFESRTITPGWYEVPPGARRHLSRPMRRGFVPPDPSYLPAHRSQLFLTGQHI
ncbi:TiaS agmantine-binding domain-containing protein [Methanospirillum sp.]